MISNNRVEMAMKEILRHFACTLGLECQLCETNINASTRTVGLDVRKHTD